MGSRQAWAVAAVARHQPACRAWWRWPTSARLASAHISNLAPPPRPDWETRRLHTSHIKKFWEDKKTTSLALVDAVKQVRHSPTPALALGFSGLVPFMAVPAYMMTTGLYEAELAQAQLYYGASILSFLGGVRWGLTLPEGSSQPPDWHNLGYSVAPSLVAWLGLLAPHTVGVLTLMGGLGLAGYMDIAMWGYPVQVSLCPLMQVCVKEGESWPAACFPCVLYVSLSFLTIFSSKNKLHEAEGACYK